MKARGLVVVLAILLAVGATAAVFLYVNQVKEEAATAGPQVTVIVATQDIPAGTALDPLLDEGVFVERQVSPNLLVEGAVTQMTRLRDQTSSQAILAFEQIPTARLVGLGSVPGGSLGIPEGFTAVTVSLGAPQGGGNHVIVGDRVTVYATFANVPKKNSEPGEELTQTVTLIPAVRVLDATYPDGKNASNPVLLTLALKPADAAKMVFAQEEGRVWLALLPPDAKAKARPPVDLIVVTGKVKAK